jgi:hypothetical protein
MSSEEDTAPTAEQLEEDRIRQEELKKEAEEKKSNLLVHQIF